MNKNCINKLNKVLATINEKHLTDFAYDRFKNHTPYRKGNARKNTKKTNNNIIADYPYAKRLEEGYSKLAPKGMTEPTIADIRRYIFTKLGITI